VVPGSNARRAGLLAGDELMNFNGESVPRRLESWVRNKKPGDILNLRVLRNDRPADISFVLGGTPATIFTIAEDPQAPAKARAIRDGLLRGKPMAAAASFPAAGAGFATY